VSTTELSYSALHPVDRPRIHHLRAAVTRHVPVGTDHAHLELSAPAIAAEARPGQFVMITVARDGQDTPVLPRPMAIYSIDRAAGVIGIVYTVRGRGTKALRGFAPGEAALHVVGPLGRGFDVPEIPSRVLLVGRGIGVCSLTTVAQCAVPGTEVLALTSARHTGALVGAEIYRSSGATLLEVTDEAGDSAPERVERELLNRLDARPPELIFTCGSNRLATLCQRLAARWGARAQVSLEAHMACGLGYCHGCATAGAVAAGESPLVCQDGPVFVIDPPAPTVSRSSIPR
jgi:dihydroorotate dehydrogenase electron transfer subunit